ncbi:hypothetical protein BD779DRAFT_309725 [Infundibulicybe gibba]|nr:hypothetical protein BD779DRAFT_309725 [Infundibulicybe gibba]
MRFLATAIFLSSLTFALGDTVTFYKKQACIDQIGATQTLNNQCVLSKPDLYAQSVYVTYDNTDSYIKAYQSDKCNEKAYKVFKKYGPGCHSFDGWTIGTVRKA